MTLLATTLILSAVALADAPKPDPPPRVWLSSTYATEPGCLPSVKAITYYRRAYTASREAMGLAGAVPRVWYQQCVVLRRRAAEWRGRAHVAERALAKWREYHYDWHKWLPLNWQKLGACETGYGRRPGNWLHANSGFVSAFGITRRNYSLDAAASGTPQWDDRHPPTPRQQYLAALAHYHRFGDGWGCPGP